ncbi:MAG: hypothetical protein QXO51_08065 [Halobacteria archaeon]
MVPSANSATGGGGDSRRWSIALHVGSIEAHRSLRDDLLAKVKSPSRRRRISVTDLTNPRQSYFKRVHPEIVPTLRQQQFMWSGTGFHEDFQRAVSKEEYVEQFIEWEGVVGKIDIYEKYPLELKTTGRSFDPVDLPGFRPYYIEQVGMYCAMTGNDRGHLVIYSRNARGGNGGALRAYEVFFTDIEVIRAEIRKRRDLLVTALEKNDPSALPQCSRYGHGCEYEEFCGCGQAKPFSPNIVDALAGIRELPDMAAAIGEKLRTQPPHPLGLSDLVFPRKAYFKQRVREREVEEEMESMEQQGMLQALKSVLFRGSEGGVAKVPVSVGEVRGRVTIYRKLPVLLRTPGFKEPVDRSRLASVWPHYFERLALECALSGHERGRLVLYYKNVEAELGKFLVYEVGFRDLPGVRAEFEGRAAALKKALETGDFQGLPACPAWMAKSCQFAPGCGCSGQTTLASAGRQTPSAHR